jgi:hypothetical protein
MRVKITMSVCVAVPLQLEVEVGNEDDPYSHEIKDATLSQWAAVGVKEIEEAMEDEDADELHRRVMEAVAKEKP